MAIWSTRKRCGGLAGEFCAPRYFMIQSTSMTRDGQKTIQVAGIILAAGGSARMGEPKQLLSIGGRPMVRRVTESVCAAGLDQVVLVVGANAKAVEETVAGLPVELVLNKGWTAGLSGSLRLGIGALRKEIQAALMVLADQPALTPALLQALIARYRATRAPIVVPYFEGIRGNPVLFDRKLFPDLLAVQGDQGGRALLARHQQQIERVETHDRAVLLDIDTRQDYDDIKTWQERHEHDQQETA